MVTCGEIPRHWRKSWTVWELVRGNHWHWLCCFATNDPAKAMDNAAARGNVGAIDALAMAPGERPIMPKGRCHRNTP